jgi:hypothetical protein
MISIRRTLRGPSVLPKTQRYRAVLFGTRFHNDMEKRIPYQSNGRLRRSESTPASVSSPLYNTAYLSRTVKAIC